MNQRNLSQEEKNTTFTIQKMHSCSLCNNQYDENIVTVCPKCSCPPNVTKVQLEAIRLIGQWQMEHWQDYYDNLYHFLSFDHYDQDIINPFKSDCSRFDVNPFLEYPGIDHETKENIGTAFVDSDFLSVVKTDIQFLTADELAQHVISQIVDNINADSIS